MGRHVHVWISPHLYGQPYTHMGLPVRVWDIESICVWAKYMYGMKRSCSISTIIIINMSLTSVGSLNFTVAMINHIITERIKVKITAFNHSKLKVWLWLKGRGFDVGVAKVASFQISDRTTIYQMSKTGPYPSKHGAYPSKHVRLRETFHKEKYLSLQKVIPMDKFVNYYKVVF